MRKLTITLLGLMLSASAQATSHRTFVAAEGVDIGTCGPTAPCRSLEYALGQTNSGGEIIITSNGGYGNATGGVTIGKSISIIAAPGVFAALAPTTGNGVTIATAGISVVINGLNINGRGGTHGIHMTNGASLTVTDSKISNFGYIGANWPGDTGGAAIYVNTAAKLTVTNTTMRYNGYGIRVAGGAQAVVSRVQAIMNGIGAIAMGPAADTSTTTSLSISDSLATHGYVGFVAEGQYYCSSCVNSVSISNSEVSNNIYGMFAHETGTTLFASGNRAEKNSTNGMSQYLSAVFNSAGNNVTLDNGSNTFGTITSISGTAFH